MADFGALIQSIFGGPRTGASGAQPVDPYMATPKLSRGQLIAGILADALAGAAGQQGPFAARMGRQQQEEREDARWGRRLEQQEMLKRRYPDVSPMERDARAWAQMTQPEKDAYLQMNKAREGDPIVTITLPNGQMYSGPRSGLAQAMMGGGELKPIGTLRPYNGGQTPPASGNF
jgi:hypothetical protein